MAKLGFTPFIARVVAAAQVELEPPDRTSTVTCTVERVGG